MKWIIVVLFFFTGCTITVAPLPKKKVAVHYRARHTRIVSKDKINVVDSDWLENYKKMEKENNYVIPGDEKITSKDGKFEVPQTVLNHYDDMLKAHPTPHEY